MQKTKVGSFFLMYDLLFTLERVVDGGSISSGVYNYSS